MAPKEDPITPERPVETPVEKSTLDTAQESTRPLTGNETSRMDYYDESTEGDAANFVLPSGWKYAQPPTKFLKSLFPWYASPKVQLGMVSLVCFLCPGMFNALSGLGGAGKVDHTVPDQMNTALYSTFSVFGFVGGSIVNRIGVRITLSIGGLGYCIYALALILSEHFQVNGFAIFSGALLGFCAALLWTAQGCIMISYPHEADKGKYFGWFWAIFNLGAVIGSLIPLGQNIHVTTNKTVTDGTYIAFIVLMFFGAILALCLVNGQEVIRDDGSKVVMMKNPTWKTEFRGMFDTLKYEPYVVLLFPMFLASNWFVTYQQNGINGAHFATRTKALNSCLYYLAQIIGALLLGYLLDTGYFRRSVRAKMCHIMLFVMTMVIWGGGYAWQKNYTRESVALKSFQPTDWTTKGYVGPLFLYIFYGFYDSLWQASAYWYMGCLSNSGRHAANYVGFYKGIQSAGAAVVWALDSKKVPFMSEFASTWALLIFALLCAGPVIFMKITDHTDIEDDLQGTDETIADVALPGSLPHEKSAHRADASGTAAV